MPRVKLTEFRAKKLLLGDAYRGVSFCGGENLAVGVDPCIDPPCRFVVKVDQGIKKRFKQGLVKVNISAGEILSAVEPWKAKGFSQFIAEPFVEHSAGEEQYLSLERVREGIRILHTAKGGIDIEAHPEAVRSYLVEHAGDISLIVKETKIPETFLEQLISTFNDKMFAFLEINPLVIQGDRVHLLDSAVLVDSAGVFFVHGAWTASDLVLPSAKHPAEARVEELAKTTPASLKLSVLNPDGALFFLLSGGGGSIVIADTVMNKSGVSNPAQGAGKLIGNYGEYSGGPTREETFLYAREVLGLLITSGAPKKALIIAGGVANFTDVKRTFAGIIDALTERSAELRKQGVKVFVRRGGPNEQAGLSMMREFLTIEGLLGAVYGSEAVMTKAVEDAIAFVKV